MKPKLFLLCEPFMDLNVVEKQILGILMNMTRKRLFSK
jgi:hypothetical protein